MHDERTFLIPLTPKFNELFFALARNSYLGRNRRKAIVLNFDCGDEHPVEWFESHRATIKLKFESVPDDVLYDPVKEFCVYHDGEIRIFQRIHKNRYLYGKGNLRSVACIVCNAGPRVQVTDIPLDCIHHSCTRCETDVAIKDVWQCMICCTVYIYN